MFWQNQPTIKASAQCRSNKKEYSASNSGSSMKLAYGDLKEKSVCITDDKAYPNFVWEPGKNNIFGDFWSKEHYRFKSLNTPELESKL